MQTLDSGMSNLGLWYSGDHQGPWASFFCFIINTHNSLTFVVKKKVILKFVFISCLLKEETLFLLILYDYNITWGNLLFAVYN